MKIERYLLSLINEHGIVLKEFWHDSESFPKIEDVLALARKQGWMEPNDKLEWQRANSTALLIIKK